MRLSPKLKVALIIAAAVILVLGLAALALYPQYQKSELNKQESLQLESELLSARTVLAHRTQLQKNHAALLQKIKTQKEQVPDDANQTALIRKIQDLAYANNHWMTSIKNSDPVEVEGQKYNAWDCEITLEGNWLDTLSFMRELRDMDRQVRVNKVTFQRATDLRNMPDIPNRTIKHWDPEAYPVRTVITATIYYIPTDRVAGTDDNAQKSTAASTATTTQGGAQ